MDVVYSPALAFAIAAAVVAGIAVYLRRPRAGIVAGAAALVLLAIGATSHVVLGHAPGSASALGFAAFLREHPALAVTAVLAAGLLFLAARKRDR